MKSHLKWPKCLVAIRQRADIDEPHSLKKVRSPEFIHACWNMESCLESLVPAATLKQQAKAKLDVAVLVRMETPL